MKSTPKTRNDYEMPRGIFLFLGLTFSAAGLLGSILGSSQTDSKRDLFCLIGASLVILLVQMLVSTWSFAALKARVLKIEHGNDKAVGEYISTFPTIAILRLSAATALAGTTALIAFIGAFSLKPSILVQSAIWMLITQSVFMFPAYMTMKRGALHVGALNSCLRYNTTDFNLFKSLLTIGIVSAVLAALSLYVLGNRIVSQEDSASYIYGLLVIASALLVSALVAIRQGIGISKALKQIEDRAEAFPKKVKILSNEPLPKELAELDSSISQMAIKFYTMKRADTDAIESGCSAREMKTEFFAGMSHDLRSPLNSVIGFTDLLLKGMEGTLSKEQTKRIGLISSEAQKLMILISDILDTSKLEAGRLEIDRKWVPSVEILTECTVESERLIGSKPIVFQSSFIPGLPPVYVDKARLCQTLVSLVSRVLDMIEGGTITLKTSFEQMSTNGDSGLRVDLVDTSRNVGRAKREQIEKAFKASEGILTTAKAGSLGLGMALAREVLHLHDGELKVLDPNNPESIFGIILPLESKA